MVVWMFGGVEVLGFWRSVEVLRWLFLMLCVCFGTGMHNNLVPWMHVVFINCWLVLKCGHRCCLVGLGLQGVLGRCAMWSCNGEKLVSCGCRVWLLSDSVLYAESVLSVLLLDVLPFVLLFGSCTIILDCFCRLLASLQLFCRLLASFCKVHCRSGKVMSHSKNKFGNFHLRLACFCMQAVHIFECVSVEVLPWALGVAYSCHCGLEIIEICNNQCCRSCNGCFLVDSCCLWWSCYELNLLLFLSGRIL